ncbi:hypothetical protein HDU99_005597 [Rhizoclosmatium hyalinum]|nr:hypothetical protein HDU99_005597 [Rhizoclosmatium hyalinum]
MRRSRGVQLVIALFFVLATFELFYGVGNSDSKHATDQMEHKPAGLRRRVTPTAATPVDSTRPLSLLSNLRAVAEQKAALRSPAENVMFEALAPLLLPRTQTMDHNGDFVLRAQPVNLSLVHSEIRWSDVVDFDDTVRNQTGGGKTEFDLSLYRNKLAYFQNYITRLPNYNPNRISKNQLISAEKINKGWRLWWGNSTDMANWSPPVNTSILSTQVLTENAPQLSSHTKPFHSIRLSSSSKSLPSLIPSSSSISCAFLDYDIPLRYCATKNIGVNVSLLRQHLSSQNVYPPFGTFVGLVGETWNEDAWFGGRIMGNGAARWLFDGLDVSTSSKISLECDAWIDTPLLMVSRWDTGNPYQAHQDYMNTFAVFAALNLSTATIQPILLDHKTPAGPFASAWSHIFTTSGHFITLQDILAVIPNDIKTICLAESVWNVHGGISPMARYGSVEWYTPPEPQFNPRPKAPTTPPPPTPAAPLFLAFRAFMQSAFRRAVLGTVDVSHEEALDHRGPRGLPVPKDLAFLEELAGGEFKQEGAPITVTYAYRRGGNREVNRRGVLWEGTRFGWPKEGIFNVNENHSVEENLSDAGVDVEAAAIKAAKVIKNAMGKLEDDQKELSHEEDTKKEKKGKERKGKEKHEKEKVHKKEKHKKEKKPHQKDENEELHQPRDNEKNGYDKYAVQDEAVPKIQRRDGEILKVVDSVVNNTEVRSEPKIERTRRNRNWWNPFASSDPPVPAGMYAQFRAVDFSELTWEEQVGIAQGTDFFIGPHGALEHIYGFVNTMSAHIPHIVLVKIDDKVEQILDKLYDAAE